MGKYRNDGIRAHFEMLLDSELIKKINFEVRLEERNRFVHFLQELDPFKKWPLFRKPSDLVQSAAITYDLLQGIKPISSQKVIGSGISLEPMETATINN